MSERDSDLDPEAASYGATVHKMLTHAMLEIGEIPLGPGERQRLGLGEHRSDVVLRHGVVEFTVEWAAKRGRLCGGDLIEVLQLNARLDGSLRLTRESRGAPITLELLARPEGISSPTLMAPTRPGAVSSATRPPAKPKQRHSRATERYRLKDSSEYRWEGPVGFLRSAETWFHDQLAIGGWDGRDLFDIRLEAEQLAALTGFESLLAVDVVKVDRFPWQESAAQTVLNRMRGRAILADEVGLGKTIEAGLIIKELRLRALAERVLVICPATLREQWRAELAEKFDEDFVVITTSYDGAIERAPRLIMSLDLARRLGDQLARLNWDLVILDEAHKATGDGAKKTRTMLRRLESRYALFLTATPVQNKLVELFRLVDLLRPGTFQSEKDFLRRYVSQGDQRVPVDPAKLRQLVSSVMVRTTRAQAGLDRVQRRRVDVPFDLSDNEHTLYQLAIDVLRLTDANRDTFRRLHLARRLSSSPRSLATTLLAMAQDSPDPLQQRIEEIAHRAADLGPGSRFEVALDVLGDWSKESGGAIVFTQHTDTVVALLEGFKEHGISAVPFHGGMAAGAKAASLAAFRSGKARLLVSTDAGAEGLNLQSSHCVLNYDLPWNPMRIEQRIGRVHRVTQKHPHVNVANLFARRTIDERVYELLRDKLAMFELLFGQVTTILGELEGGEATFEHRVVEALTRRNDGEMAARLESLGRDLDKARRASDTQFQAAKHIDSWAIGGSLDSGTERRGVDKRRRAAHRSAIPEGGATELLPDQNLTGSQRQLRVADLVIRYLRAEGAELLHEERGGDPPDDHVVFGSWALTPELTDRMQRSHLHLAFDRTGLDVHPDAELCAVGSEVFDDLVASLRIRGDLFATAPPLPTVTDPPFQIGSGLELIDRRVGGPLSWGTRSWWRVAAGDEDADRVEIVEVGLPELSDRDRSPFDDGRAIPEPLGSPQDLVAALSQAALPTFALIAERRNHDRRERDAVDRARLLESYRARLNDDRWSLGDEAEQLARAVALLEQRPVDLEQPPVNVELLAIELVGGEDFVVLEQWRTGDGAEHEITYPLVTDGSPILGCDDEPIETLGICVSGHPLDVSRIGNCASCNRDLCPHCEDKLAFCRLCTEPTCRACRRRHGGLCRGCGTPTRVPELDDESRLAWTINRGMHVMLGTRHAELIRPGEKSLFFVNTDDLANPVRARLRAQARLDGLPLDIGLDGSSIPQRWKPNALQHMLDDQSTVELRRIDHGGSAVLDTSKAVLRALPNADLERDAELSGDLEAFFEKLRRRGQPPPPASLLAAGIRTVTIAELGVDGLHTMTVRTVGGDAPEVLVPSRAPFTRSVRPIEQPGIVPIVDARLREIEVRVDRVHRVYRVQMIVGETVVKTLATIALEGSSLAGETIWAELLATDLGTYGHRIALRRSPDYPSRRSLRFAQPIGAQLERRTVTSTWSAIEGTDPAALPVRDADLPLVERPLPTISSADIPQLLGPEFHEAFQGLDTTPWHAGTLICTWTVSEIWVGEGRTERTTTSDGRSPILPVLDDSGSPSTEFEIDSLGHLHTPRASWPCPSCRLHRCTACGPDGRLEPCTSCGHGACGDCRSRAEPVAVNDVECRCCGARSCATCGRDIRAAACQACGRATCAECLDTGACRTCRSLQPADAATRAALPAELVLHGVEVTAAQDADSVIVAITGNGRREIAVVSDGQIEKWVTIVDRFDVRQIRAARLLGESAPALPIHIERSADRAQGDEPHLRLRSTSTRSVEWLTARPITGLIPASTPIGGADPESMINVSDALSADLGPVPETARSADRAMLASLLPTPRRGRAPVQLVNVARVRRIESIVLLTARGLWSSIGDSASPLVRQAPWQAGAAGVVSTAGWSGVVPKVALRATIDDIEATITGVGPHVQLVIHDGSTVKRWRLGEDRAVLERRGLADALRSIGASESIVGDEVQVATMIAPHELLRPSIIDASWVGGVVEPVVVPASVGTPGDGSHTELVRQALTAFFPTAVIASPAPDPVDLLNDLRSLLINLWEQNEPATDVHTVAIGLRVSDRWVKDRVEFTVEYELAPGATQGQVICADTGQPAEVVHRDRSGHLAAQVRQCWYCISSTCSVCPDAVSPCITCGFEICARCRALPIELSSMCPACASAQPLGWLASRRVTKEYDGVTNRRVLEGTDRIHTVRFVPIAGGWKFDGRHSKTGSQVSGYVKGGSAGDLYLASRTT